jgi:hypothetical protein
MSKTSCIRLYPCKILRTNQVFFFSMARQPLGGLGRLIFRGYTITNFRHNTLGRTPLDEGPARRRDLFLTTHNTHKRQTSMPLTGFEPTIPISERPQTHALDRTEPSVYFVKIRQTVHWVVRDVLNVGKCYFRH